MEEAEQAQRTIAITGATRGIGRALTEGLAARDHVVHGCGTSPRSVRELRALPGLAAGSFECVDVTSEEQVNAWAGRVIATSGAPDLLINNAGVINQLAPFWEIPREEFDRLLAVNVLGVANVLRAFLPAMVARRRGIAVNISSGCGHQGYPGVAAYCASKFGVEGLSQALAEDLPAGMASIALSPGVVDTDMLRGYWGPERSGACDPPERWAEYAVPYVLGLGPQHNGRSLRVPAGG